MADRTHFEEYPSPFAHPLQEKDHTGSARSLRVMTTTTALCLIVGIGAILILTWANHRPASVSTALPVRSAVSVAPAKIDQTSAGDASAPASSDTRPSLAFYTQRVHGGLFSAPQPPAPKFHRTAFYHRPPQIEPSQDTEPSIVPAPIDPFVDWSYDGTVKMGDTVMALLENTKTKEGQYVQTGSTFLDARVERITERSLTLRSGDKTYTLPKSQKITVVPLDKSAPYLTQSNTPPKQPPTVAPGQTTTGLPGFANYTPEQRAMMRQYWRQYRQMYRGMGMGRGGYGKMAYPPYTQTGQ